MRQVVTLALLVVFGAPFVTLSLSAESTDSKLPACCRRDGKHKCGMTMAGHAKSDAGENFTSAKAPCPSYPRAGAVAASSIFTLSAPAATLQPPPPTHVRSVEQAEALFRIAFSRTRQKRGPPVVRS